MTLPLLLFKTVEAPMTGGWLFNKIHFGIGESVLTDDGFRFEKLFGHEIVHTSFASKWIDTYIGLGFEIYDTDLNRKIEEYETFFVSEAGIKLRLNVSKHRLNF